MQFEQLESRRLLSVSVAVTDGVLTVTGDDANNVVHVHLKDEDTLVVRTATATPVEEEPVETEASANGAKLAGPRRDVELSEETVEEFDISAAGITSILMNLGAGNDHAGVGPKVTLAAVINGDAGNDRLFSGEGADTLNGGEGNDCLRGGKGADTLNGGAGNDRIDAADGVTDTVDGGDNATDTDGTSGDVAIIDAADGDTPDTVSNVESTRVGRIGFGGPGDEGPGRGPGGGGPGRGPRPAPPAEDDGTTTPETAVETPSTGEETSPPADGTTPPPTGDQRPPRGPRPDGQQGPPRGPRGGQAPGGDTGTGTETPISSVLNTAAGSRPVEFVFA